jgi:hypothetical protein
VRSHVFQPRISGRLVGLPPQQDDATAADECRPEDARAQSEPESLQQRDHPEEADEQRDDDRGILALTGHGHGPKAPPGCGGDTRRVRGGELVSASHRKREPEARIEHGSEAAEQRKQQEADPHAQRRQAEVLRETAGHPAKEPVGGVAKRPPGLAHRCHRLNHRGLGTDKTMSGDP